MPFDNWSALRGNLVLLVTVIVVVLALPLVRPFVDSTPSGALELSDVNPVVSSLELPWPNLRETVPPAVNNGRPPFDALRH